MRGELERPSRWLWLVKPILAIPHFLVLVALGVVAVPVGVAGGVAVAITGRYPRPLFDYIVGVLRWSWRLSCYSFPVNGTDAYPPFDFGPRADYPADLEIDYPEQLTHWGPLLKWWLLALPQYLLVFSARMLVPAAALIAGVALLCTGTYPSGLFDLQVGLARWRLRVLAYALLLRDEYPVLRLDQGPRG
ncbi:MAG: DUF4389 domain-containing protein [Mycobacteriaceae bacterium]|nr:DUF4389 domain-containing protein [Mycobacteriaceae bacterium]